MKKPNSKEKADEPEKRDYVSCLFVVTLLCTIIMFFVNATIAWIGAGVTVFLFLTFIFSSKNKKTKALEPEQHAITEKKPEKPSNLPDELQRIQTEVGENLNKGVKEAFRGLCAQFEELMFSQKKWLSTLPEGATSSQKVFRKEVLFDFGAFHPLKTEFEIPVLRGVDAYRYYIYPKCIIKSLSATDFKVVPLENVEITYLRTTFTEKDANTIPADSEVVDGKAIYGEIEIKSLGLTYLISKAEAAKKFVDAFAFLKQKLSGATIDEPYFNMMNKTVENFHDFFEELKKDVNFHPVFHETFLSDKKPDAKGQMPDWKDITLRNIFCRDVVQCYAELEHPVDFTSKEGLGLLLFMARFMAQQGKITFVRLNSLQIHENEIDRVKEFIKLHIGGLDEKFLLSYVLGKFDADLQKKYLVLLYRFASIAAKADGVVSEKEEKWLSELLRMEKDVKKAEHQQVSGQEGVLQPKNKDPHGELRGLIGLTSVKSEIETLENFIKIQQARAQQGLKSSQLSYHVVFTGNPGTGKTTVGRIVAEIYKELGVLKKGHLVETDRSGLVAGYVGQTAIQTNDIVDSALDGVLFIDEAYALASENSNDYGSEAIATLLKRMEDNRDRLVVIVAGYTSEMKAFINSNPGLQSRFNRYIEFPDYSADELFQIFQFNLKKFDYTISKEVEEMLRKHFEKLTASKDRNFGNARTVRNFFEKTLERQANRLSKETNLTSERLSEICGEDVRIEN
jgi:SpoVK/Ycf46/Vps4 family AAA+-type ATPase